MEFDKRLERAIIRGRQTREAKGREAEEQAITEEELRALHSRYRIELSEHIEACLRKLAEHFPGFEYQTIVSEDGWGARISRDDVTGGRGRKLRTRYSRLEMVIRPFSSAHIIELTAKAAVRNKEIYNRTHFQFLSQADMESFTELIDLWALEYAERYSAQA